MAFTRSDLALLAPGGAGGGLFQYRTDDALATVGLANYFGPAAAILPIGSRILLTVLKSTTPLHYKLAVSASNPATLAVTYMIATAFA